MSAIHLSETSFQSEVMQSQIPVLVDFFAQWCGPCRQLAPTIEALADKYSGKVKVCKSDVDEMGSVAAQFGIQSIPTLILFKDGKAVAKNVGFMSQDALEELLDQHA